MKLSKKVISFLIVACSLFSLSACVKPEETPAYVDGGVVTVSGGQISGLANSDGSVAIYKGVPYAAAPVGDLRWKAPQEVEEWEGVKDCSLWGANAIQGEATTFSYWTKEFVQDVNPANYQNGVVYSEDCLSLNIWSSTQVTKDKPVLVYIHGGGYNSGGAACPVYDGENIAKQGVVFVSIQYRVGVFGFLATEALQSEQENSGAGNYGILDQIKALEWVQDNIKTFGGDPTNVTIMGQSAGAGSVNALLASPLAKDLFISAVSASHNSINRDWQTVEQRISSAPTALKTKTVEQLREMDVNEVKNYSISNNGPVIDDYVLTNTYLQSILNKEVMDINLMTGMVAQDNLISSVYTNASVTVIDSLMTLQNNIITARLNADYQSEAFVYLFNRNVPQDDLKTPDAYGAKHSYELAYFFGNFVDNRPWSEVDYQLSKDMMGYLVNFCISGNPNGENLTDWQASVADYSYMSFADECSIKSVSQEKYTAVNSYYNLNLG
ncbi:MAG: carboxylesterase family protein [Clostridiales bacterium]|nr:carboxylesterase family protein [Clostridiales bacterium]